MWQQKTKIIAVALLCPMIISIIHERERRKWEFVKERVELGDRNISRNILRIWMSILVIARRIHCREFSPTTGKILSPWWHGTGMIRPEGLYQ